MKLKSILKLIYELLFFFGVIATVSFFWKNNLLLLMILLGELLLAFTLWHQKHDFMYCIVAGILGPIGEVISVQFGVGSYSNPTFLGIPIWLPVLWGLATVMLKNSKTLFELKKRINTSKEE